MKKSICVIMIAALIMSMVACTAPTPVVPDESAAAPTATAAPVEPAEPAEAPTEEATAASDYPSRTIELIVPFGVGGGTDVLYRLIAKYAEPIAGVKMIVNNIEGSGGLIGRQATADAEPDGYTIGYNDHSNSNDYLLYDGVTLSGADYEPLARIATDSLVILASKKSGITNMKELIEKAAAPEGINCATAGNWSAQDFMRLQMQTAFNITLNALPFDSGTMGVNAVAAGDCDVAFCFASEAIAQVDAGNVVPVAVSGSERNTAVPDIPTIIENGYEFTYLQWRAMVLPKGADSAICTKLSDILTEVYANEEFRAEMAAAGFSPDFMPYSEFKTFYYDAQKEYEALIAEVKAAG